MPARGYSAWGLNSIELNAGREDKAAILIKGALGDLGRAWRNVAFSRCYDSPEAACEPAPQDADSLPGAAVPAGCVRIDSALGEVPPVIFGEEVWLEFAARGRLAGRQRTRGLPRSLGQLGQPP